MGPVTQAGGPANLRELSDKELLTRYCAEEWKRQRGKETGERRTEASEREKENVELAEELWRRHQMKVYDYLSRCGRAFCPAFYDPGDLVHDSHMQAQKNFIKRICGFRNIDSPRSFKAWCENLARTTMLDERRKVTESRLKRKRIFVSLDEPLHDEEGESSETVVDVVVGEEFERLPASPPERGEPRSSYLVFRSRYSTNPRDPAAPVERKLVEGQRSYVVGEALRRHAESSEENAHSARVIRWRHWRNWTYATIGARIYGESTSPTEKNTQEQRIKRVLEDDYERLFTVLRGTWGIVAPGHL